MSNRSHFLFLTSARWSVAIGFSLLVALASFPWWLGVSVWAGCAAGLTTLVILHMAYASAVVMPLAHVAILVCAIQYCLSPWAAYYFPAHNPQYLIPDFRPYFAYAGPAFLAFLLGWTASCLGLHLTPKTVSKSGTNPELLRDLHRMFWGAIGLKVVVGSGGLGGLAFLFLLLADLRFISVMALMILGAPGWRWRTAVVLALEVIASTGTGMFHELVLWLLSLFAVYVFIRRPPLPIFLGWLAMVAI